MEEKTVKVICTGLGYGNDGCYSENDIDVTNLPTKVIDVNFYDDVFVPVIALGYEYTCPYCGMKSIIPINTEVVETRRVLKTKNGEK